MLTTLAPERGIYCGWGPEPEVRNPGDLLCLRGAEMLLAECGSYGWADARPGYAPAIEPWHGDVIVGGGTVLPTVFDARHAPGLTHARKLFIFGSGCLAPDEWKRTIVGELDPAPYHRARVIGVRGPLSARHYQQCFGTPVPYVGDLAFAYATDRPVGKKDHTNRPRASLFLIENRRHTARLLSHQQEVLDLYSELQHFQNMDVVLLTTDDKSWSGVSGEDFTAGFSHHIPVGTADDLLEGVKSSDFVITERLHPAILAACFGIPFLYLQTTSKSFDLQALLVREGVPPACFLDMSTKPPTALAHRVGAITAITELPEILVTAAGQIRRRLEKGAAELAHESSSS